MPKIVWTTIGITISRFDVIGRKSRLLSIAEDWASKEEEYISNMAVLPDGGLAVIVNNVDETDDNSRLLFLKVDCESMAAIVTRVVKCRQV